MKTKWSKKLLMVTLSLSLFAPVLAACSKGEGEEAGQEKVLRIGTIYSYGGDDSYLRQQYTDIYEYTHPNVKIEFVSAIDNSNYRYEEPKPDQKQPDPFEETKKLLSGPNAPDVMIMDTNVYKKLVRENMLKQLDPMIQQDKFDTSDIVPTVMDGIKELGDNNIYGLAPTFTSSALFYNKKFFTQNNIEPPKDGMSWEDVFTLARRLKSGDGANKKFGLQLNRWSGDPFYDMTGTYLSALQLRMFDDKGDKMTVDTPAWEKAWSTFAKLVSEKVIPTQKDLQDDSSKGGYNPLASDSFLSGKTAMTIADYSYVNDILDANKNASKIKNFEKVDWDVVTLPTHPEAPGIGGNIYLNNLMGINAKAQNDKDAWDFIKFLNSEEWAKLKSRSSYEIVSRKKYIQPKDGLNYNIAAFYTLKPVTPNNQEMDLYNKYPNIYQVQEKGREIFQTVLDGKKSSAEGLKEWQKEGDKLLVEMKKNPGKPIGGGGEVMNGGTTEVAPAG